MPWAGRASVEERRATLARWEWEWDAGGDLVYGLFLGPLVVGGFGLHRRIGTDRAGDRVLDARGAHPSGLCDGAAAALTHGGLQPFRGITVVEIHHDRANVASEGVPRKLDFTLVEEYPRVAGRARRVRHLPALADDPRPLADSAGGGPRRPGLALRWPRPSPRRLSGRTEPAASRYPAPLGKVDDRSGAAWIGGGDGIEDLPRRPPCSRSRGRGVRRYRPAPRPAVPSDAAAPGCRGCSRRAAAPNAAGSPGRPGTGHRSPSPGCLRCSGTPPCRRRRRQAPGGSSPSARRRL